MLKVTELSKERLALVDLTTTPPTLVCTKCGDREQVPTPTTLDVINDKAKIFNTMHQKC